jgi:hypothetical protein
MRAITDPIKGAAEWPATDQPLKASRPRFVHRQKGEELDDVTAPFRKLYRQLAD